MNTKNGFIYDINYKGKKIYAFVISNKQKRNTSDAIKIVNKLEEILEISKEKYGNMYDTAREMSIRTVKENMQHVILHKYKDFYGIHGKHHGFTSDENDEVIIIY